VSLAALTGVELEFPAATSVPATVTSAEARGVGLMRGLKCRPANTTVIDALRGEGPQLRAEEERQGRELADFVVVNDTVAQATADVASILDLRRSGAS